MSALRSAAGRVAAIAISVVAVLVAAACSSSTPTPGASAGPTAAGTQGKSGQPIVIGGSLGLTGSNSGPSAGYMAAAQYWQQQVNSNGGLLGRQVQLKIYDDQSTQQTAQQLYQRLIDQDHADFLLAPFSTAVAGAVVPIVARSGKILFNGGFVSKEIQEKFPNIVSSWTYQDTEYSEAFFDLLKSLPADKKPKTIAIVTAQSTFTLAALNGYKGQGGALQYAKDAGIQVVFNQQYDAAATSQTSLMQRAKASGAQALLALTLPNDGYLIAKTADQIGWHPNFYCSCGAEVTTLPTWPNLGAGAYNVYSTTLASASGDESGLSGLTKYLSEKLKYATPPAYAIAGYAALQVLQDAVEATKTMDQSTLWKYVLSHSFKTAAGTLTYNSDGTVKFGGALTQYQQGNGNVVVWPSSAATQKPAIP